MVKENVLIEFGTVIVRVLEITRSCPANKPLAPLAPFLLFSLPYWSPFPSPCCRPHPNCPPAITLLLHPPSILSLRPSPCPIASPPIRLPEHQPLPVVTPPLLLIFPNHHQPSSPVGPFFFHLLPHQPPSLQGC